MASVLGSGGAQHHNKPSLHLQRQVSEDGAHQWLVDEQPPEHPTALCMVDGMNQGEAHHPHRRCGRIKAGLVDHLDDGAHSVSFLADSPGPGADVFDLARCVGAISQLVLEALDVKRIACPVGRPARHQKARQSAGRLGQGQEGVGHGCRTEPLVAGQPISAVALWLGPRGVGAHVRAACFSVMAMPNVTPSFSGAGTLRGSYAWARMRGSHSAARSG